MAILYRDPAAPPALASYVVAPAGAAADRLPGGDAAWRDAQAVAWGPPAYRTTFRAAWSSAALFIRFDCEDDRPWHTLTRRDDPIWDEEVVEIFLDPAREGTPYAEVEISPANVVCDLRVTQPWPGLRADRDWDWAGLDAEVRAGVAGGGRWTALARLPWEGLVSLSPKAASRVPPQPGDRWRFNVFRIKRPGGPQAPERGAVYAAWSVPDGPSFHVPAVFRDFVFG
jgi:hypothetical protein